MMTQEEAKAAVEATLGERKQAKPMTDADAFALAREMSGRLRFQYSGDRQQIILAWINQWRALQRL
jgi:hypothetical protein